jgi:arylsulfatase A-like enzyme
VLSKKERRKYYGSREVLVMNEPIESSPDNDPIPRRSKPLSGAGLILFALAMLTMGCGDSSSNASNLKDVGFRGDRTANASESDEESGKRSSNETHKSRKSDRTDEGQPNIVLVSVDDLDLQMTQEALPQLQKMMADKGVTFENAFVTNPICCPSRATTLRGQYAQNTLVQGNQPPQGGYEKFHRLGRERSTFATWLDSAGYQTAYMGKYMNGYQGTEVPPGWDDWLAVSGDYASDDLTFNGQILPNALKGRHETDVLAEKSSLYIESASQGQSPFFLYLAPRAPHQPAIPAKRHEDLFSGEQVPADPSEDPAYNEADLSDKPLWLRQRKPLTQQEKLQMGELHRNRLRSMKSVEDMMVRLEETLRKTGELENTYIVFTSDNGHHLGQHRLPIGKWTAYEEDIRVPLMIRGPGVPEGESREQMVLNNDFAPTFSDLAGAKTPPFVDGRSLTPLLQKDLWRNPPTPQQRRQAFLVEGGRFFAGAGAGPVINRPQFDAVRTERYLYVEYATGARELYDLRKDPHQLENLLSPSTPEADSETTTRLAQRLDVLRGCSGEDCHRAETMNPEGDTG